jgi:cysteine desulfurase
MLKLPVYLDHNATTPCDPRVVEAMLPFFSLQYGNAASRNHSFGWQAEEAVNQAREQIASLIGAHPKEIIFTSGATESANLALRGAFETYLSKGNHIITTTIEHKSVLDTCRHLETVGGKLTILPVNTKGLVDPDEVEAAITPETILVAIQFANNETGTIQPVKQIGEIAKKHGVLFFSDATQATGKIPVNVISADIDLMSFSAHKIYGPKGSGALYVRRKNPRVKLKAQILGGGHENNLRSGTLNVPGIVGFGTACALAAIEMDIIATTTSCLRDRLENAFIATNHATVNGSRTSRLPHVTNISFTGIEAEALIMGINKNIAVSSGAACTSATIEPSHVLKALGLNDQQAFSSIRFGLGKNTTDEEIDYTIKLVSETVNNLRSIAHSAITA